MPDASQPKMSRSKTMSEPNNPQDAFKKAASSQKDMESAMKAVSKWLTGTDGFGKTEIRACARMILCGSAKKHIDGLTCGTDKVASTWRNFNKPCIHTSEVDKGRTYSSLFTLWMNWLLVYDTLLEFEPKMAKYKVLEVDGRRYWTPVIESGSVVFKSNPFVALNNGNAPLTWNDVWLEGGEQYLKANYMDLLKAAVPVVLSKGNAIPFAQIGKKQIEGSRRLTHGSKGRVRSNPKAWGLTDNGARRRQDMLNAQMELTNWVSSGDAGCGYRSVIVISPGYKQRGDETNQWWKVTPDGRKFKKERTFENEEQLKKFAQKQKDLRVGVAVWMPSKIVDKNAFKSVKRDGSKFKFDDKYKSTIRLYCP